MLLAGLVVATAHGAIQTTDLRFEFTGDTDSDGSDGWDGFRYVGGSVNNVETIPIKTTAPTHVTASGAKYFSADTAGEAFGSASANVTENDIWDYSVELIIRKTANGYGGSEHQIAGFWGVNAGRFVLWNGNGGDAGIDVYLKDRGGNFENLDNVATLHAGFNHLVFTYQDSTGQFNGAGPGDDVSDSTGILTVYQDGAAVTTLTGLAVWNGGYNISGINKVDAFTQHASDPDDRTWEGDIGVFRIYENDLTSAEVLDNFNAQAAAYDMDDGIHKHDLRFEFTAADDTDGSDGWDGYRQVSAGYIANAENLPVGGSAPTHLVSGDAPYFHADTAGQTFASVNPNVTEADIRDFTFELMVRKNGNGYGGSEHQLAGFYGYQGSRCVLWNGDGSDDGIDVYLKDRGGNVESHDNIVTLHGGFNHLVFTYQDSTGASDGVLTVYQDGYVVTTLTDQVVWNGGYNGAGIYQINAFSMHGSDPADRSWEGDIGVLRIYEDDLTAAQVLKNFNAQQPIYIPRGTIVVVK